MLNDSRKSEISFADFYLTPMEKYAKRPETFAAKDLIVFVSRDNSTSIVIDDAVKSFEPPVQPIEEKNEEIQENKKDVIEPSSSFEQIDLFASIVNDDETDN